MNSGGWRNWQTRPVVSRVVMWRKPTMEVRILPLQPLELKNISGSSSVGRAPRCQRGCRGFKSRLPLHLKSNSTSYIHEDKGRRMG